MSGFTLAYLARLEMWGLAAALVQGALVLASWRAWERTTRGAGLRHRLACIHFAALIALPAATVAVLHWTAAGLSPAAARGLAVAALPPLVTIYERLLQLAPALAVLWLAGAVAMILSLALEARRVAGLVRAPAPALLVESAHRLARGGIGARAPAVRTADVRAPQIVGLWRPTLLAPPDLAARLSAEECDAVLLHELAHVRRGDFGCNLVQRLALALIWFHPAAWVLYGWVSREREASCDALAVRHGASAAGLARALVRLAETQARPGLAMAISGRSDLGARVRRLLEPDPPRPSPTHARLTAVAVSALALMALGAGRLGLADPAMADLCNASALGPTISFKAHDPSGSFALRVRHGRVIEASVETRRLPADHIVQHGDLVTLVGAGRRPIVALTVTPQGRIRWTART